MQLSTTTEQDHHVVDNHLSSSFSCSYLPHHPIIKESSSTTKLRVVFDASAKTSNGKSLNDTLVTGPALQTNIIDVISNWRFHQYVFTADMEKFYRRVKMHPADAQYQRILWRNDPSDELQSYALNTVTFGTSSAPFSAIRVIHQLADDERQRFPLAANILRTQVYVDDILTGANNLNDALKLQKQLIQILQSGGFDLRKWTSNSATILNQIPVEHRESKSTLPLNESDTVKALGLYWQPSTDSFHFKINFNIDATHSSKRIVLSTIARLFDPLGWLNPVIIAAKILLKQVWNAGLDWDDELSPDLNDAWLRYVHELQYISNIVIPRWINTTNIASSELHTFCDGSMNAYAAATYLRVIDTDGNIHVNLLTAKCKVSPLKQITIPRIELSGALLASKLAYSVQKQIRLPQNQLSVHFWTDSTIVLAWLRGDPNRWKTFVSNRIHGILARTKIDQWNHVVSEDNPADCSSRGLTPRILANFNLWWHGPTWLSLPCNQWPNAQYNARSIIIAEATEAETRQKCMHVNITTTTPTCNEIFTRYSSITRLRRVIAWCFRFTHNSRTKRQDQRIMHSYITVPELRLAMLQLVKLVQFDSFRNDLHALKINQPLAHSRIEDLTPQLDEIGVLRVGGRLELSKLSFAEKHPIIIPTRHVFTDLLIDETHRVTAHGGTQLVQSQLRRRYWIICARKVIRNRIHYCITCYKNKPRLLTQQMGNLPAVRLSPSRPFASTGIDYAGPIHIRPSKGRGRTTEKGYISIFICLATKAIHLEAVSDLTTPTFLAALNRFIARRGYCHDIYSDNGTNFIGAHNQIEKTLETYRKAIERDIIPDLANREIQWHFIPPSAPHFGGLWEAGVKSVKFHLKRIVGNSTLTYEELSTVLTQIESCLNSRPLCPITNDPDDFTALTPGHFLTGDALLAPPTPLNDDLNPVNRWHNTQLMVNHFWQRWSTEYLSRLQSRPKWLKSEPNLNVNDLVLIKDDRVPPNQWLLGRVTELNPGKDNLVRVVTIKTANGTMKRPVVKLCRLPNAESHANELDYTH